MKCTLLFVIPAVLIAAPQQASERMQQEILHELVTLPNYTLFDYLAYRMDGTKVTLLGEVVNPTLKSDAERAVQSVEGVTEVVNDIEVLPASSADDQIRLAVYRSVYGKTALQRYAIGASPPIHIIVKNGNVALEGVVLNEMDKSIAGVAANEVPGVFSVQNNLRTEVADK